MLELGTVSCDLTGPGSTGLLYFAVYMIQCVIPSTYTLHMLVKVGESSI